MLAIKCHTLSTYTVTLTLHSHPGFNALAEPTRLTDLLHAHGIPTNGTAAAVATLVVSTHLNSSPKEAFAGLATDDAVVTSKRGILRRRIPTHDAHRPRCCQRLCVLRDAGEGRRGGGGVGEGDGGARVAEVVCAHAVALLDDEVRERELGGLGVEDCDCRTLLRVSCQRCQRHIDDVSLSFALSLFSLAHKQ